MLPVLYKKRKRIRLKEDETFLFYRAEDKVRFLFTGDERLLMDEGEARG